MPKEIKDLKCLTVGTDYKKFVVYEQLRVRYSEQQITFDLLQKHGCKFIRKIPCSFSKRNMLDVEIAVHSYDVRLMVYDGIYFLFDGSKIVVDVKNHKRASLLIAQLIAKYRMTSIPVKQSPVDKMTTLINYINSLYINEDTANELIDALAPFVTTYQKRKQFNINMCLGIILCGKPGDGKTYNSEKILRAIGNLLDLPYTQEEVISFEKAAKLANNFVGLIDDMNIAHFKRLTGGSICANILSEMDKPNANRLFFFTTNEEINRNTIDKAFFRPGRVQHVIHVRKPNEKVKSRVIDDMMENFNKYSISVDQNFLAGIRLLSAETELSLAEMINLRRLIITDKILEREMLTPQQYIEKCASINIEQEEVGYVNDDAVSH